MNSDLALHIVLLKPPINVDYGLQKGSGSKFETIQIQKSNAQDLHFELTIQIAGDSQKDKMPGFAGSFVQGKPGDKFIYIDIGKYAGQSGGWSGRIKVPLSGIAWDIISQLEVNPCSVLETHIPGTKDDGSPNCATNS